MGIFAPPYTFDHAPFWFLLPALLLLSSCQTTAPVVESPEVEPADGAAALFELMQGSFDSSEQAAQDSAYYAISLHMYPIWPERGQYLYVEQALAAMQDKPYRQRVYELRTGGWCGGEPRVQDSCRLAVGGQMAQPGSV